MEKNKKNAYILKWVIYAILGVLVLSYFSFDLKSFFESDSVRNNFAFIKSSLIDIWNNYLKDIFDKYILPIGDWFNKYILPIIEGIFKADYSFANPSNNLNIIPKLK